MRPSPCGQTGYTQEKEKDTGVWYNFLPELIRIRESFPILEHTGVSEETERKQKGVGTSHAQNESWFRKEHAPYPHRFKSSDNNSGN